MIEVAICDRVASKLSFHNAAEGDCWRNEHDARQSAYQAWKLCRRYLWERGILETFLRSGTYLLPPTNSELAQAAKETA